MSANTDYGYPLVDPKIERIAIAIEAISTAVGGDVTETAIENALKSEGFAVGEQNGTAVTSGSPYYENNSKYYSEQAAQSAADAASAVTGLDSKAPKASPVFTGSISLGRATGSTVGMGSVATGDDPVASGNYSHAEGIGSVASGAASHAEGGETSNGGTTVPTTASGANAHAEGGGTTASGADSHSEGTLTEASGVSSHSEGGYTEASGQYSHAEGYYTEASGNSSSSGGSHTVANHRSQTVFGEYNTADPSAQNASSRGNYVEIVGNGTSNSARSNARTLDWAGNEVLAGKLTVGAGPTNDMDVATKAYVDLYGVTFATDEEVQDIIDDWSESA